MSGPEIEALLDSLSPDHIAALKGRFAWKSPLQQQIGEQQLLALGLWDYTENPSVPTVTDTGKACVAAYTERVKNSHSRSCDHAVLTFHSGGFYVQCKICKAMWTATTGDHVQIVPDYTRSAERPLSAQDVRISKDALEESYFTHSPFTDLQVTDCPLSESHPLILAMAEAMRLRYVQQPGLNWAERAMAAYAALIKHVPGIAFDAAQFAADQRDETTSNEWDAACIHIAEGIRRHTEISDGAIYARLNPPRREDKVG